MTANSTWTRRGFFIASSTAVFASAGAGCKKTMVKATQVVVQVAWKYLTRLVRAVMRRDGKLIVAALIGSEEVNWTGELSEDQRTSVKKGAKLIIRTEDGKEHEVTLTVE